MYGLSNGANTKMTGVSLKVSFVVMRNKTRRAVPLQQQSFLCDYVQAYNF